MNLAQALGRGLIAEAIAERRRPGPTLEECKSKGTVSVRVHSADLPIAPTDLGAERERMRIRRRMGDRSRGPRIANQTASVTARICSAIRDAGRRLSWREIEQRGDIRFGTLGSRIRKLLASGTLTRTGSARYYLYGFPGMD